VDAGNHSGVRGHDCRVWVTNLRLILVILSWALLGGCTGSILEPPSGDERQRDDGRIEASLECPSGQDACGDACVDLTASRRHCGECEVACEGGDYCRSGHCTRLCPAGELECDGECTPVLSDPEQCGTCGRACAPGEFCNGGVCSATCSYEVCEGPNGLVCADTISNARHCGACGATCPAGESCVQGYCEMICPTGYALCDGACVRTPTDAEHCGGCGRSCAEGIACIEGACGCSAGQSLCGGSCVDTVANPAHCGGCGNACGGGSACVAGACVCPTGQTLCSGTCADLNAAPAHCGACGKSCAVGEICDGGACVPESVGCSGGRALCSGACVDTQASVGNCGACGVACPAAQSCVSGACVCPGGGALCGETCVDLETSNSHCGGCGTSCTGGRSCVGGSCECSSGEGYCGGTCVGIVSNDDHCGACGEACGSARSCVGGVCECPGGSDYCEGECIDYQSNGDHCGACGNECLGGQICHSGDCVCPDNQVFCDGLCIDPETSLNHCGGCGFVCFAGEVCSAGRCQGPIGADQCGTAARGLSIREVAAYQSVKVSLMQGQQAIAASARGADVVRGRETLVRVFVDVEAGFTARELSARLTLFNGGVEDQYFEKRVISGNSIEGSTSTTFQIFVPPDKIGANTRYAVEVVECGTATGTLLFPRFPDSGDVALEARNVGGLRVAIVPVLANTRLPDTSEPTLEVYRSYLQAMFPATTVEFTVTSQISTAYPIDWSTLLTEVRAKRQSDGPSADVYYYGFVRPTDTMNQYCQGGCTAGIGYVPGPTQSQNRVAVGLAYGTQGNARTMAHELGHNHGRNHAPCGNPSGVDQNYPHAGARLGAWGYDSRTRVLIDPDQATDIMSYCSSQWVSDYTYNGFVNRMVAVNGATMLWVPPEIIQRYQLLLLDAQGQRWGAPYTAPAEPFGDPEDAEILDANLAVIARVTVYRSEIADIDAETILVPEPMSGWYAVRVAGAAPHPF
jgi:hypothetical protein